MNGPTTDDRLAATCGFCGTRNEHTAACLDHRARREPIGKNLHGWILRRNDETAATKEAG